MSERAAKDRQWPFGLSATTLRLLQDFGYIKRDVDEGDPRSFQDLLVLRTVRSLRAAQLSTRTINRTLKELRPWFDAAPGRLAPDSATSGIRIQDGATAWIPSFGQYTLPL